MDLTQAALWPGGELQVKTGPDSIAHTQSKAQQAELADCYTSTWVRPNATYLTQHTTNFNGTFAPIRKGEMRPRNALRTVISALIIKRPKKGTIFKKEIIYMLLNLILKQANGASKRDPDTASDPTWKSSLSP